MANDQSRINKTNNKASDYPFKENKEHRTKYNKRYDDVHNSYCRIYGFVVNKNKNNQ
ncbi:MAG: hypothetical protein IKB70_12070 [Bacilli bacterium]|nr:hypothetical protein [Bacilli bacterium]